jgi:hypothetical protein
MNLNIAVLIIIVCGMLLPLTVLLTLVRLIRSEPLKIDTKTWMSIILQYAMLGIMLVAIFYVGKCILSEKDWFRGKRSNDVALIRQRRELLYEIDSNLLRCQLLSQPKYQDPLKLTQYEGCVNSQNGEDGIIAEIFDRIGITNRYFVEFGSADGIENNTRCLLKQGWGGLWMDGDSEAIAMAKTKFAAEIAAKRLTVTETFITAENIEKLFVSNGVPKEFDLLSIDIDRNDYYVWKAIEAFNPRVVVIEYNGNYPPGIEWVVEYKADAWWDGSDNYGASLSALEKLGKAKGYSLVGCTMAGVNAFFVRDDLLQDKFLKPYTAKNHYEPPRYWMTWGGHK